MQLYRFRLIPESPWRTPWQSDTLAGLLCWAVARAEGNAVLRDEVIEPALQGQPPFVLSDAFPGDWLPVPALIRQLDWPVSDRKTVKRARWIDWTTFQRVQRGEQIDLASLIRASGTHEYIQLRNTIERACHSTTNGGSLFPTEETVLGKDHREQPLQYLTVYTRIKDEYKPRFWQSVQELSSWGFGADRSVGKGQFRLGSDLEPWKGPDDVTNPTGCVVLSTFQPNNTDPTEGTWEAFTKYGKLGPDFGFENVFKRPLLLLRPGACFTRPPTAGWLGRAIPMSELLAPDIVAELQQRNVAVIHWGFGLSLPLIYQGCDS